MAIVAAIFAPVCGFEFLSWDDNLHVVDNPFLNPITAATMPHFWKEPHAQLYIPLTYSLWMLISDIARLPKTRDFPPFHNVAFAAGPFHAANFLLHVASSLVVFLLLRRLLSAPPSWRGEPGPHPAGGEERPSWMLEVSAAAGALLFALHPVQVEAVAWISELKGVLSGFFSLLALWLYVAYRQESPDGPRRIAGVGRYAFATLAFACALLSKPSAVIVPIVAVILDIAFLSAGRPAVWKTLQRLSPWFALALAAAIVARFVQPPAGEPALIAVWKRPFIAGDTLAFYVWHVIAPVGLCTDYGRTPDWVLSHPWAYATWLLPAALTALVWRVRRRYPWAVASATIFAVVIIPVSGIVPFEFQKITTVADRYLYLAMLGPAIMLAFLVDSFPEGVCATFPSLPGVAVRSARGDSDTQGRYIMPIVVSLLLLACAVRTAFQIPTWRDSRSLFSCAIAVNPASWTAHATLGFVDLKSDDYDSAIRECRAALSHHPDMDALKTLGETYVAEGEPDQELVAYRDAFASDPTFAGAHLLLGNRLLELGRTDEALTEYQVAARIEPANPVGPDGIGACLLRMGQPDQAVAYFRQAIALNQPDTAEPHGSLADALIRINQLTEALAESRKAVELDPFTDTWRMSLGEVYSKTGDNAAAAVAFRDAIRLNPASPQAHYRLGMALARQGNIADAITEWRTAELIDPNQTLIHDSLAAALAQAGEPDASADEYRRALAINPSDPVARADLAHRP